MASGLAHPQYNSGDVSAPDADIDGARAFYARHGVGWGVRVPAGMPWRAGRRLLTLRLMGARRGRASGPPARSPGSPCGRRAPPTSPRWRRSTRRPSSPPRRLPRAWLAGHLGAAPVTTAIAEAGGEPVGTGYALRSDGDAGPCLYLAGVAVLPSARGRGIGSLRDVLAPRARVRGRRRARPSASGHGRRRPALRRASASPRSTGSTSTSSYEPQRHPQRERQHERVAGQRGVEPGVRRQPAVQRGRRPGQRQLPAQRGEPRRDHERDLGRRRRRRPRRAGPRSARRSRRR